MDTATVTALVKELNEANSKGQNDDVVKLLKRFKDELEPTEEILRASRVGVAVGKMRSHRHAEVAALAKELVKKWKDAVEAGKKRKRDDAPEGEGGAVKAEKKIKAEAGSSGASPAASTPDGKPSRIKDEKAAVGSSSTSPRAAETGESKSAAAASTDKSGGSHKPRLLSTISFDRKTPRNATSDGMADRLKADGGEGEDIRNKTVKLIYDALAADSNADKRILAERAVAIEREAVDMLNGSTGNDYRAKMRSLYLNLKDAGNPGLRNEIVLGHVSAEKVVTMSKEDMASESVKMLNERIANENLFKAKSVGETQAETDAFKCGRCQQRKCTYYQMQTRSADEPMTTFVTCTNCGNRWKFS